MELVEGSPMHSIFLSDFMRGLKESLISQDYRNLDEISKIIAQVTSGRAHFAA